MKTSINSVDIAYDDHGIGLPMLFLHAFPLNRRMWAGQVSALLQLQRFRLVALDWRGFGESSIDNDVSTMELLADDVASLMNRLGMQQAIICGLSMGGYVAFAFLRKYPQRVSGLILADTRPGADTEEGKANRVKVATLAKEQGPEAIAALQVPRLISDHTKRNHPEVEARVRQMIASATPHGIAAASLGMTQRADSSDMLASITCPTLVLTGEHDALIPLAETQEYAAKIPGAQFAVIPQAGHISNLEQPAPFLTVVRNFLLASF